MGIPKSIKWYKCLACEDGYLRLKGRISGRWILMQCEKCKNVQMRDEPTAEWKKEYIETMANLG